MNENQDDCVTDATGQEKNKTKASEKPLNLDHVVRDELGEFGWFQLRNILLVTIPIALSAFKNDYIFTAAAIPHRCRIPECGETGKLHPYDPSWILNAVPDTSSGISSCTRYAAKDPGMNGSLDSCPAKLFDHMRTVACEGFVYSKDTTVVYEFDLGCQQWLRALAGTMTNIGLFLGLPISGYISDRFGRRISVVYNIFGFGIMGVIRSFSVNYTMFLILQLGQTIMGASVFTSSFILAAELIGPKYRAWANVTLASTFSLGQMLLGGIAWLFNYWRHMTLISCVPCLFIIAYYWILSESFRWLLSKGKYVEARKVIETAARINKKTISEKTIEMLMNPPHSQTPISNVKDTKAGLVRTIVRSPVLLKRVCTTPIWWIASTFVYYGLSINSTGLSSTMYLNYILTSAVEIPGFFCGILFLDRIGRKATISSGYFFSALCNLLFVFIPFDRPTIRLITYLLGKFGISMSMGSLYLYTSELYPTEYRQTLLAFSSMIGRLGSIVAPLTPVFTQYWHGLPSVMFAALGLVGGGLVLTQPETLGTKLPDTLAEAERLGKPDSKLNSLHTHTY